MLPCSKFPMHICAIAPLRIKRLKADYRFEPLLAFDVIILRFLLF